jgi:translation initiation factor 2 subunit 3
MKNQPTIIVGIFGTSGGGKSTIVEKLSGKRTRFSTELKKNITIKLGYANAKIFKCIKCPSPQCYQPACELVREYFCKICGNYCDLKKFISIIDNPGHSLLTQIMVSGMSAVDSVILVDSVIESNVGYYLDAINMLNKGIDIVCLNKVDLIGKKIAFEKIDQLKRIIGNNIPIIPMSASGNGNVDVLCEYICKYLTEPVRNDVNSLKMPVLRSFNINKQNIPCDQLKGGVIGGVIASGCVNRGDRVILYPGTIYSNPGGKYKWSYRVLVCNVISIYSGSIVLDNAVAGGLVGIQLDVDPGHATNNGLVGNIVTTFGGHRYCVYEVVVVEFKFVWGKVGIGDELILNSNGVNCRGRVVKIIESQLKIKFIDAPLCSKEGEVILAIKANILIGRGIILNGKESKIQY